MGFILNKKRHNIRIGGPCDQDEPFIIHNIENVPGADIVNEGIYFGGHVFASLTVRNNSVYDKIAIIRGFSGWGPG